MVSELWTLRPALQSSSRNWCLLCTDQGVMVQEWLSNVQRWFQWWSSSLHPSPLCLKLIPGIPVLLLIPNFFLFFLKFSTINHPYSLLTVHTSFCLTQIPMFLNYSKELPTFFLLPRKGRYNVTLPAQERCSQTFSLRKWEVLTFEQPELGRKPC